MVKSRTRKIIEKYRKILLKEKIPFKKIIIFGSQAKGFERSDSDIDLCIVLDNKVVDLFQAQIDLISLAGRNQMNIDIIATTVRQFSKDKLSPILHQIRTTGTEYLVKK